MKRLVFSKSTYNNGTDFIEICADIQYDMTSVCVASMLDLHDPEFFDFEGSLLDILDMHGFELEDAYQSHNSGSISQYYILIKTNSEGTRLRVFVKLRVSDHNVPSRTYKGREISYRSRDTQYVNHEAQKFAQERFNQERGYRPRRIDIVLDGISFASYEQALRHIEDKLDEFDPED